MFTEIAWLIPTFPLLAFLFILLLRGLPKRGAELAIPSILFSLVISLGVLYETLAHHGEATELTIPWMQIGGHEFGMGFLIDPLSAFMATLVSFLALLIVIYSPAYLREEGPRLIRYFAEVTLFVSGMLVTVLADNYLLMFAAWEVMGLCSYLLIGFWFEKPSAASAAKKAFLVTRVGDVSLLLGLLLLYRIFDTFSYREIFASTGLIEANSGLVFIASVLIFGGAVGKSAQFPLHVWLPDAMEGPTTVSALIHAATMVKAGVFLVARSFPLFIHTPDVFPIIAILGGITALLAATMALVQFDIKRVLAYSTLSQLGYMFLALGAGGILAVHHGSSLGYTSGLFHLMNHAFFKALLFLGAGSVILGMHHHNDMRKMGGLHRKMPLTSWTVLLGTISIAGLPPFSGFWSKDDILASAREAGALQPLFSLLWAIGLLVALLTALYMFRMWYLTFLGKPKSEEAEHAHESPKSMTIPLAILAVFAVGSGFFLFTGFASFLHFDAHTYLAEAPASHSESGLEIFTHIIASPFTYLSVVLAAIGVAIATSIYVFNKPPADRITLPTLAHDAHQVLVNLYYYDRAFMATGQALGMGPAKAAAAIDKHVIDGAVNGIGRTNTFFGGIMRRLQTGVVTTYALVVIAGLGLILIALYGGMF
jgi:proton-translocating NADH-quinone oxidoreductase chain L